ncbi:MAG: hypothetical protein MPJ50_16915 [Pirellulales bacterium]|nr:hypothetical protein [Pirellulales bacterium]
MKQSPFIAVGLMLIVTVGCNQKDAQNTKKSEIPTGPVKANVDTVGTKGKNRDGGYLTTVVAEKYRVQDRVLLMMLDKNLSLYRATNGRLPADFDELKRELVDNPTYQSQLPELPQGTHFEYNPGEGQFGTLWVVPDGQSLSNKKS